jgi:hypothetical protein
MIAITFGIRFNLQIVIKQKLVVESRFVKYFVGKLFQNRLDKLDYMILYFCPFLGNKVLISTGV